MDALRCVSGVVRRTDAGAECFGGGREGLGVFAEAGDREGGFLLAARGGDQDEVGG